MNEYPNQVKKNLTSLICEMSESPALYVKNPGKDFTRNRKLPFEAVVKLLIAMGGNSIYKELLEMSDYDIKTATSSAFVQQRDKILPFAFESLLQKFTHSHHTLKLHEGFRLLAVDGSNLHIPCDPNDPDTHTHNQHDNYNIMHLNALFDICNKLYVDAVVQPVMLENERKALIDMVCRSNISENVIVVGDRNYEGYNCFAHIEAKGWNYVIRVKDVNSNGILSKLFLPSDDEFDTWVHLSIIRKQSKETKAKPHIYKHIPANINFDFLEPKTDGVYPLSFRVVRFKTENDSYASVVTNLPNDIFTFPQIKEIYALRWGIESSFRTLKYTIGLNSFHSKKQGFIAQEIFARLIMYNFTEMITSHVVISQTDTRLNYQINFIVAVILCRHFLRSLGKSPPPDVEAMIRKNLLPIRPGRKFPRKPRCGKAFISFVYRIA